MKRFSAASLLGRGVSVVIGVMFLVIGLIFFLRYDPSAYDVKTTGTITEIEEHYEYVGDERELMYTVYIDYTANGTKYEHREYMQYNSKMKVGDTVEFFCMSEDPTQIAGVNKEKTPILGLGLAVIGLAELAFTAVRIARGKAF